MAYVDEIYVRNVVGAATFDRLTDGRSSEVFLALAEDATVDVQSQLTASGYLIPADADVISAATTGVDAPSATVRDARLLRRMTLGAMLGPLYAKKSAKPSEGLMMVARRTEQFFAGKVPLVDAQPVESRRRGYSQFRASGSSSGSGIVPDGVMDGLREVF